MYLQACLAPDVVMHWRSSLTESLFKQLQVCRQGLKAIVPQVGAFPHYGGRWAEWNGNFRDTVRSFIKGSEGPWAQAFASAVCGSPTIYAAEQPGEGGHLGSCLSLESPPQPGPEARSMLQVISGAMKLLRAHCLRWPEAVSC